MKFCCSLLKSKTSCCIASVSWFRRMRSFMVRLLMSMFGSRGWGRVVEGKVVYVGRGVGWGARGKGVIGC